MNRDFGDVAAILAQVAVEPRVVAISSCTNWVQNA
jgi:hypothetical protein